MRLLLDTHVYLWFVKNDRKLSAKARELIASADNVYVSSASIWEIAIKIKLGKLGGKLNELISAIEESGFQELPITIKHTAYIYELPDAHRDPFDRILVAQAICEPLRFLTADNLLSPYSDLVEII